MTRDGVDKVVPLLQEEMQIEKRQVSTGKVRIRTIVDSVDEIASATLSEEQVSVTRIPVGRVVTEVPAVRTENGVTNHSGAGGSSGRREAARPPGGAAYPPRRHNRDGRSSRHPQAPAVERLAGAGIPRSQIRLVAGEGGSSTTTSAHSATSGVGGFWDTLADLFMPDEDRYTYAEGLRRGGEAGNGLREREKWII